MGEAEKLKPLHMVGEKGVEMKIHVRILGIYLLRLFLSYD